ncbi:hypothetical protein pdam_00015788 [Pocillopora damicornis]|uniref:Uncharacterized protein n=1 Tax=Pocillopora damicornis TaxID=46731 RepID=A0A3M6UC77_POCDA|nr:hypothetical protein pdam_00015788 [Pocillopora damicornis]
MGWGLHKPKGGQRRFSDKVRGYLQKKFDIGKKIGWKEDPAQVANDMRNARNTDGSLIKQSDGKETSSDDDEPDDNEELAEEYASLTDEQMLEKANVALESEIGVKHPVMYDVYNLCEMAFENRL